jgi:conjugal transfer pilus assembly protein TraF
LVEPTESNIIEYIKAQEKIGDRSEKFAKIWQQAIYKHPNLDRTLKYPVSNNALHIARYDEVEHKRNKIKSLSKEYGLMYFFMGDCKYCVGFSSVVKNFADFYNWDLMPIQIGNVGIDLFKNIKKDNGISITLGIKSVPALIAVHPKSGEIVPLAFGYISESEIEDRVNILIREKKNE